MRSNHKEEEKAVNGQRLGATDKGGRMEAAGGATAEQVSKANK